MKFDKYRKITIRNNFFPSKLSICFEAMKFISNIIKFFIRTLCYDDVDDYNILKYVFMENVLCLSVFKNHSTKIN